MVVVMQPVSPWSPRPTPGIDSVKWHGIPLHSNDVFVVGNALRGGRKQKESVVRALLI